MSETSNRIYRFGVFELDLGKRQLRRNGVHIKLQDQPFNVLVLLLERPDEIVTREELQKAIWPEGTFVDFDHGLNAAVQSIRRALGDSAENPRFVKTIHGHGYSFIAPVEVIEPPVPPPPDPDPPPQPRPWFKLAALVGTATVLVALLISERERVRAALALLWPAPPPVASGDPRYFVIPTEGDAGEAFISPDGLWVAYSTGGAGFQAATLWIRDLRRDEPRRIAGPGRLGWVGWSPGSEQLAYVENSTLFRLSVGDWQPSPIAELDFAHVHLPSGSWTSDGTAVVLAAPPGDSRLIEVGIRDGASRTALAPDDAAFKGPYSHPHCLPGPPGSRKVLYVETQDARSRIVAADLVSGKRQRLFEGTRPVYSPSGHILFQSRTGISAVPFSVEALSADGPAAEFRRGAALPSADKNGTLVFLSQGGGRGQMIWKDRRGLELGSVGRPQDMLALPKLSPAGDRIVATANEDGFGGVWVHEVDRPATTRVARVLIADRAAWHPNGKWIAYAGSGPASHDIYLTAADGTREVTTLVNTPHPEFPHCWTSDGRRLLFNRNRAQAFGDLWYAEVDENGKAVAEQPILATEFDESSPILSPDDRFLAYVSDKSGRHEVYVRTFPEGDREWVVSTNGGAQPRWRGDAREMYYVDAEGTLFAVPIAWSPEFSPGHPKRLFDHPETLRGRGHRYDVTPDGQRFVVVKVLEASKSVIRVVDNWFAELRRLERGAL